MGSQGSLLRLSRSLGWKELFHAQTNLLQVDAIRPQAGGLDEKTAGGGNAPASGIFEKGSANVDHDGEDVPEHDLEVTPSDDEDER